MLFPSQIQNMASYQLLWRKQALAQQKQHILPGCPGDVAQGLQGQSILLEVLLPTVIGQIQLIHGSPQHLAQMWSVAEGNVAPSMMIFRVLRCQLKMLSCGDVQNSSLLRNQMNITSHSQEIHYWKVSHLTEVVWALVSVAFVTFSISFLKFN